MVHPAKLMEAKMKNSYTPTERTEELIKDLFTFHPANDDQKERMEAIRSEGEKFATFIARNTPASPEQTLAIRALHLCTMHAISAISVHEDVS
jgi:hypothetical protein